MRHDLTSTTAKPITNGPSYTTRWDVTHAQIAIDAGIEIYFCDPHSPWQRGSNENTNGLLRQYWPKGHDMRHLTQADCDEVALSLNTRPRQTLGWQTPQQAQLAIIYPGRLPEAI